jgi:inositol-1,4,5-trisphosphate 5-phosphatase
LAVDQLTAVRSSGEAFSELDEQRPTFPPTFKYKVGSRDVLDGKRRPAWTDRILYRVNTTNYEKYK